MVLKSYAKINLTLSVNRKLSNRLHDIQSFFCMVNLFDTILINKNSKKRDVISFIGPQSKFVKNSNNSIKKVLLILRKNNLISDYYSIKVNKKIPVFAGFGGGSSNAAVILKFLLKKNIKNDIKEKLIKIIGSDLRLFFYDRGYQKNLKTIIKNEKNYKLYFLLVYPNIKCSTKEIYAKIKNFTKKEIFNPNIFKKKRKFINYLINASNDLQSVVEKKHQKIKKLLLDISSLKGCYMSRITGSGSACYGLFLNTKCSKAALKKLRKKYPKFWFSIAKTI